MKSIQQRELVLVLACLLFTKSSACFEIRLNGSESRCSGRVEILVNRTWGTVCDDGWDLLDAEVLCRELNCGGALAAPGGSSFGGGEGPIWLDDVDCSGYEGSLSECHHRGFGTHNCGHGEDAGVICSGFEIRLNGSESRCSGRVEILFNRTWGTVCDDGWDFLDAEVLCREINCGEALAATGGSSFGGGEGPIWLDEVDCSGGERSLSECRHRGFGTHNCGHSEDAGVICSGFPIRLNGSESRCSGRVEILVNRTWGTVCDDGWDLLDAEVLCRELNCGKALAALGGSSFVGGEGPIWLDEVACSGGERSLSECRHRGFGTHNCGHIEDAGVICSASSSPLVYETIRIFLMMIMVSVGIFVIYKKTRQAKQRTTTRVEYLSDNQQGDYVNMVRVDTENLDEGTETEDYENIPKNQKRDERTNGSAAGPDSTHYI